jgi:hypothetical protein
VIFRSWPEALTAAACWQPHGPHTNVTSREDLCQAAGTLAAIGHAPHSGHEIRKQPGSSAPMLNSPQTCLSLSNARTKKFVPHACEDACTTSIALCTLLNMECSAAKAPREEDATSLEAYLVKEASKLVACG